MNLRTLRRQRGGRVSWPGSAVVKRRRGKIVVVYLRASGLRASASVRLLPRHEIGTAPTSFDVRRYTSDRPG